MSSAVNRESVLECIHSKFSGQAFTTHDLGQALGVGEYSVRGCIAWLKAGALVAEAGICRRRGSNGRHYHPKLYRWSGSTEIRHVPQAPADRKREREQTTQTSASIWLCRRWAP